MLRSTKDLSGYTIAAKDGNIGTAKDLLFDDQTWAVRYLVADTGRWLSSRKVLIAPEALESPNWIGKLFPVDLTRAQVKSSPPYDSDKPVSKRYEYSLLSHFGWGGVRPERAEEVEEGDAHLRSASEVFGYNILAQDGECGRIEDLVLDDHDWVVRYLAIDTRGIPPRKTLLGPGWVQDVRWTDRIVRIDRSKKEIEAAPEYRPEEPINSRYEERLYDYYGKPHYWGEATHV